MSHVSCELAEIATPSAGMSAQATFYCVPGIGNNVLQLHALAQRMRGTNRLVALRTGFAGDGAARESVEDLASRAVETVLRGRPEGPIMLGGYSGGASIAFEMAQQLTQLNHTVGLLALIDTRRPGWRISARTAPAVAANFMRNLPRWIRDDLAQSSPRQALRNMHRHARRLAGAGSAIERIIDVSRYSAEQQKTMAREYDMLEAYRPVPWRGSITLLRAQTQPVLLWHDEAALGWSELARGGVHLITVPGNHLTIMREPRVGNLATSLAGCIATAARVASGHAT